MSNYKLLLSKTFLILLLLFAASPCNLFSQSTPEKFIQALLNHDDNIKDYVDTDELARSERLGITYNGVKNKFLIGFELNNFFKNDHTDSNYIINSGNLEDGYSFTELLFFNQQRSPKYYFLNGRFVAPSKYFTRNWQTKESKYFIFKISEPKYFNDYCIKKLDEFVDKIADTLGFNAEEKALLEKEKLYYIFCKDEDEVQALTGYKSKGQAVLAFDEVITAYQTHYHELAHLLINFKLKTLGLYTLPFFMEGFAVAMGGRGGMAPRVVTDIGYYLQKTGFLTYDSILTYDNFMSQDANMTYAVSGLYNTYLINELGAKAYLELYKRMNGDIEFVKKLNPNLKESSNNYEGFLTKYFDERTIWVNESDTTLPAKSLHNGVNGNWNFVNEYFKIFIHKPFQMGPDYKEKEFKEYQSRKISELIPERSGQIPLKYCFIADESKVQVFNLYNDELIASYVKQFSLDSKEVPNRKKGFEFFINKKLFGSDFEDENEIYFRQ